MRKTRAEDSITLRTRGLTEHKRIPMDASANKFERASEHLQARGMELSLREKFCVIDNLAGFETRLDISGGDPLILAENWELLEYASNRLGRSSITVTATGRGVHSRKTEALSSLIGEFNFTYDPVFDASSEHAANRPAGYAEANLRLASRLAAKGVLTRAELPLTRHNCEPANLRRIHSRLADAGIDRLLLMRLFPVGRGTSQEAAIPDLRDYLATIAIFKELEQGAKRPVVRLQCALRHLVPPEEEVRENPCDLLAKSFGLMADGTLLLSPWAIGPHGSPLSNEWVLGNLAHSSLTELLDQQQVRSIGQRLDANFGHCKIFAYLNSDKITAGDRMLDDADPLFNQDRARTIVIDPNGV